MPHDIIESLESVEETQTEIETLADTIETQNALSEERHAALLERIAECQNLISQLSNRMETQQTESPVLAQLQVLLTQVVTEQSRILADLESLKSSFSNRKPLQSLEPETPPTTAETPDEPRTEKSTVELGQEETPEPEVPSKRRRVNIL